MGLPVNVTLGLDKLFETLANATGLTAIGIKKNANAEAEAESILAKKRAETDAEVDILRMQGEEKVAQYLLAKNSQKMTNVESVVSKAEQQFAPDEQVAKEPVEKDWMTRFLGIVEDVSDEDMQDIADNMSDNYIEYGGYWESLDEEAENMGAKKLHRMLDTSFGEVMVKPKTDNGEEMLEVYIGDNWDEYVGTIYDTDFDADDEELIAEIEALFDEK